MGRKLIGLLFGIVAIVIGIVILVSHFNAQKTQTSEVVATIIRVDSEVETDTDGFDTRWYYPVVEYRVSGERYETRVPNVSSTDSTEYKENDTISLQFNPEKPTEVSQKGNNGSLIGGIIFIILGFLVIVGTIFSKF